MRGRLGQGQQTRRLLMAQKQLMVLQILEVLMMLLQHEMVQMLAS
jgi:hypothetical protein